MRSCALLKVRPDLCTSGGILHGGAIMAFADMLGATGAVFNLPDGAGTTTVESKTNFIGPAPEGTTVTAESPPVHIGRRTSVWTTRITGENGQAGGRGDPNPAGAGAASFREAAGRRQSAAYPKTIPGRTIANGN